MGRRYGDDSEGRTKATAAGVSCSFLRLILHTVLIDPL